MKEVFYAIGDFFGLIFNVVEALGNIPNYVYIVVIFVFLVVWTSKMLKHRKDHEEHASS
jgi:tellurite resistance protein TehA-like permease